MYAACCSEGAPTPHGFCFVLSWPFSMNGGVNQVVNNLIQEIRSRRESKWTPITLELTWTPSHATTTDASPAQVRLHSPVVKNRALRSSVRFVCSLPGSFLRLRKLVKKCNIGVFNLHFPDLAALNFVLLRDFRLFRGKVILSFHGSDIRSAIQESGISNRLWKFLLRRADAVVACSDGLKAEVLILEPRCKPVTIYNGVNRAALVEASIVSRRWPGELAGKRVVISVGAFEHRKGHDVLVRAFMKVASCQSDVALLLVGKAGPTSEEIRGMACNSPQQSDICILEDVPHSEIHDLLRRSDVFVLASRWEKGKLGEGFAMAILEAAAAGLPVVATASCGVTELIEDRATGRVVPLEDEEALARAICDVLSDRGDAARMARNLQQRVSTDFTWAKAVDQYLALGGESRDSI